MAIGRYILLFALIIVGCERSPAPPPQDAPSESADSLVEKSAEVAVTDDEPAAASVEAIPNEPADEPAEVKQQVDVPEPVTTDLEPLVVERINAARRTVIGRPDSAVNWGKLGMVLDVHNFIDEAVICYKQAERLSPTDFRWPYFAALCMPNASPEQLAEILGRAVKLRPDYAPAKIRLGRVLLQSQQIDEAQQQFEAALPTEPMMSHAFLGLGRVAIAREDFSSARSHLEKAAAANPQHGEVFALLATVYRAIDEPERANAASERAGSMRGKTPVLDPARTEVMFEGATAAQLARQGNRLRQMQRFEQAIEKLRLSLQTNPDNPMAHFDLGLALASLGRWDEGIAELNEALRVDDGFEPARQALEAVKAERKRLESQPENP